MAADSTLRVGVVGVGYLGKFHARIYNDLSGAELIGVVDNNPDTAKEIADQYDCDALTDPADLIGKVDLVSIVVPTSLHRDVALPFLNAGIHCLIEKPLAATLDEARELVDAANRNNVILQVGHVERYNAGIVELSKRIDSPKFFEVHRMNQFTARATDVDVVSDLMIHDIDIVLSLVNSPLTQLSATGIAVLTDHVDIANARLEFENGAVANVTASRVSYKQLRRFRVFGNNQYCGLDYVTQKLDTVRTDETKTTAGFPGIAVDSSEIEPRPPLDTELADFVDVVRHQRRPMVSGEDGLAALEVAVRIQEQIELSLEKMGR